jgi:hypothetical protein
MGGCSVTAIRQEAELQGMSSRQRRGLYDEAISFGSAKTDGVTLSHVDATRRVWEDGFFDAFPLVRRAMAQWRDSDQQAAKEEDLIRGPFLGDRRFGGYR